MGRLCKNFPDFARKPAAGDDEDDQALFVFADEDDEAGESVDRKRRHRVGSKPPWLRRADRADSSDGTPWR